MGSAFFLNRDGYFLTAGHVLIEWGKISTPDSPCAAFIYVPLGEWKPGISDIQVRWFSFTECIINAKVDVAACKPIQNPFSDPEVGKQVQPLKLTKFFGLPDGTPVAFTGFPLDSLRPVTSKGNIAAYVSDRNEFMVDKASWPGISGCPVYLKNGKVIGIMREAGINLGAGMAFARPSEDIIAFLSANKINTEK
jgi:V8-like Glu-specific endopeptidase